ncbi:MBL fold metallo-hydrolase [Oceanicoccus sagamiensis]|uniref:MBL fold metallo-hydrolase n=1 Tax=Oceanicoccus sagamiensis TaxID=716816 RepID=A0A1X9NLZ2_9GAMM|nr:MBL fold metallo-hydrolase [Oceanicoccus sagamiensis]ARN74963.1 MBL fold metallo-hydrolase [Oceanicoccus sagamiensis]
MSKTIVPGEVIQVSGRVRRITAPNPGLMTGPGTNTYLVGDDEIAVIDPGPAEPAHIEAILAACGDKLRWILATHTHPDHSPAAVALAEASGAVVMGNTLSQNDGFQDDSFAPVKSFAHDECWVTKEFTLRALHTPGHVNNHLCFLIEEDGLLLTGDHIMQGSTVVIIPPHGDMKDYIQSLTLLLDYPLRALAPGHGHIIDDPVAQIEGIIKHRLGRESKLLATLQKTGVIDIERLTSYVYDDVDPSLHPVAQHSLLAHLLKLEKELRAARDGDLWHLTG